MMKVLLINGSPNKERCTYTALASVARGLTEHGIGTEMHWIGTEPIKPCVSCHACDSTQKCAFGETDGVNELIEKAAQADGIVIGSPVFYAGVNGSLKALLDRVFYAAGSRFAFKPGAAVVSARRAGTTAALEILNKYFLISQMPLVSSLYWPMVHGNTVEEVLQDREGMQVAHQLGANMAWLLKAIAAGRATGVTPSTPDSRERTNFIR
ncbi:MAG: flavodoxin family protein [Coriobacteriales bacterium]|jgi:multimeric flavodoxin WrbA|nr:flavodoxin family protein [Coriobacteriales bacterium]